MRSALLLLLATVGLAAADRPNVLWITAEDHGPHLGAYGDDYATTPVLDALAAKGMLYRYAWSTAPVCAPARTTLISGVYPPSTGAQHMRSLTKLPEGMKMYPQYLREAGYYVSNNSKEDYNLVKPGQVWDESSKTAHWRNRADKDQPFFSIFNFTVSHESQIRKRPHDAVHDPAGARVPAYHPDTPESRQDWAQYADKITEVDTLSGEILDQLEADGLADDTIVFFYADHGSGMPRSKRWTYNSGLHVPLILYIPPKWRRLAPPEYEAGGASDRLVGFIDLPPTLLSLCGIQPPGHMQGYAFAGDYTTAPQPYIYAFRGRMDERYDMVRSIRDERYIYIRNYKPHRIYGQYIAYMFQTPTTAVWKQMYDRGELNAAQSHFWETKPAEELYDLEADPDEVNNLAGDPAHAVRVAEMRAALQAWQVKIRDLGFLPEGEIHSRADGRAPYEMGHDDYRYPMERVMRMADLASGLEPDDTKRLRPGFHDPDSAVRYWAALGAVMRGESAVEQLRFELTEALEDPSPFVRIAAAEALGRFSSDADARKALEVLLSLSSAEEHGQFISMEALNAVDYMDERAAAAKAKVAAMPQAAPGVDGKFRAYLPNLIKKITDDLE